MSTTSQIFKYPTIASQYNFWLKNIGESSFLNPWFQRDGFQVYVRGGRRRVIPNMNLDIEVLDIANFNLPDRMQKSSSGMKRGFDWFVEFSEIAHSLHQWEGTFIEALDSEAYLEDKDYQYLIQKFHEHGWQKITPEKYSIKLSENFVSEGLRHPCAFIKIKSTSLYEKTLKHLILLNLNRLEKGLTLIGEEFYAKGVGRIDCLCKSRSGDFVVIEIKSERGNYREAVGQTLSYIQWVEENLAKKNQLVRGIIINPKYNRKLELAVKASKRISLYVIDPCIEKVC